MDRMQTYGLFLSHLEALHITVERYYSSYSLQVTLPPVRAGQPGISCRALILARSSDYWHERIHLRARNRPELVICSTHDTCLPCLVLALDEGYQYEACELPHRYTGQRTRGAGMVILGQLLSGDENGFQQVNGLPRSTRYRYLAHMRSFLKSTVGRPIAS